jgi:hypothetical protein
MFVPTRSLLTQVLIQNKHVKLAKMVKTKPALTEEEVVCDVLVLRVCPT